METLHLFDDYARDTYKWNTVYVKKQVSLSMIVSSFHFDQWNVTFNILMTSLIKSLLITLYGGIEDT